MEQKERLNNLVKVCLNFGDYSFMLNEIVRENVTEKPTCFGRLVMSKIEQPMFFDLILEGKMENYSDPVKLNDTFSVIEMGSHGCYIYSDDEYYYITRH